MFNVGTASPSSRKPVNLGSLNDGGTAVTYNITGAGTTNLAAAATSWSTARSSMWRAEPTSLGRTRPVRAAWPPSISPAGAALGSSAGLGASATVGGLGGTVGSPAGAGTTINLGSSVLTLGNVNPVTIANSVNGAVTFAYNGVAATSSISVNSATAATLTTNLQTIPALSAAAPSPSPAITVDRSP